MPQTTITSSIPIAAPPETVWAALIDTVRSPLWRMSIFETDWQPDSPIRVPAEIGAILLPPPMPQSAVLSRLRGRGTTHSVVEGL